MTQYKRESIYLKMRKELTHYIQTKKLTWKTRIPISILEDICETCKKLRYYYFNYILDNFKIHIFAPKFIIKWFEKIIPINKIGYFVNLIELSDPTRISICESFKIAIYLGYLEEVKDDAI